MRAGGAAQRRGATCVADGSVVALSHRMASIVPSLDSPILAFESEILYRSVERVVTCHCRTLPGTHSDLVAVTTCRPRGVMAARHEGDFALAACIMAGTSGSACELPDGFFGAEPLAHGTRIPTRRNITCSPPPNPNVIVRERVLIRAEKGTDAVREEVDVPD